MQIYSSASGHANAKGNGLGLSAFAWAEESQTIQIWGICDLWLWGILFSATVLGSLLKREVNPSIWILVMLVNYL